MFLAHFHFCSFLFDGGQVFAWAIKSLGLIELCVGRRNLLDVVIELRACVWGESGCVIVTEVCWKCGGLAPFHFRSNSFHVSVR